MFSLFRRRTIRGLAGRWSYGALLLALVAVAGCDGCGRGGQTTKPPTPSERPTGLVVTDEVVSRHNRAVALMGQFDYAAAYDVLHELVAVHPDWLDGKVDLAIATLNRRQIGDSERAVELLQQVLQRDPLQLRAKYCLGILQLDAGDPQAAADLFAKVADADPQDAYPMYYAGQCEFQLGQVESALSRYEKALQRDPYLRSCYYGAFQACLRLGKPDQAEKYRRDFEQLEGNPQARLAEIKYTRMGPKAELRPLDAALATAFTVPAGPLFELATEMWSDGAPATRVWVESPTAPVSISVAETQAGGPTLVLLTQAARDPLRPNVVLEIVDGKLRELPEHPLSTVSGVLAAVWGDYDNDGSVDVYLCRQGPNQLWRQVAAGSWQDVTEATGTAGGDVATLDGQMFDADHDGDLDLLLINDGPNELLNNNLNGTFRPLATDQGLTGGSRRSIGSLVLDLDRDRDLDLVVINQEPPHDVYLNDRLWAYRATSLPGRFATTPFDAALAVDANADGQTELVTWGSSGVQRWQPNATGEWESQTIVAAQVLSGAADHRLSAADLNGDARLELVVGTGQGCRVFDLTSGAEQASVGGASSGAGSVAWSLLNLPARNGPSLLGWSPRGLELWRPGAGRLPFISVAFTGKEEQADQMRSNRSGIGVDAAARIGTQWVAIRTLRADSGPGQSLQPSMVGLAGRDRLDFVRLVWPDGVFQTEYDLASDRLHRITETQRQVSSCPVVFAWDGSGYQFVTDVLGVGGLGFNLGAGEYAEPRPWENLLLNSQRLLPREGRFQIKLAEPMEEACYLDRASLVAYDLPAGWQMTVDERFAVQGPSPSGRPLFYRESMLPTTAHNDRGETVLTDVAEADGRAAEPGRRDPRFIGRTDAHWVELEFPQSFDRGQPYLVFDGWIEYPYSQTMFAAWQAGASFAAPTLEVAGPDGRWQPLLKQFGYMAGMPRQAVVPLDVAQLPAGACRLRLSAEVEVYWDRLLIAFMEPPAGLIRRTLPLVVADVAECGFAQRTTGPQRRPHYDYQQRRPVWDTRHLKGFYSEFGSALPLVEQVDDAVAIIGPGEEFHLEFAAEPLDAMPLPAGYQRFFVLELNGWCKDMDLFTREGETVAPLPRRNAAFDAGAVGGRGPLHERNHRRFRMGY